MPASTNDEDSIQGGTAPCVRDLLGQSVDAAFERYGRPETDRRAGEDRWLRFEAPNWTLRLRARPSGVGGPELVRSWTAAFAEGFDTVPEALRALGLPPAEPSAGTEDTRLPLRDGAGRVHSLTLSVRRGRIRAATGFDEPPDWDVDTPLPDDL
ncbi:hypothetical protein [Candidatus Palauibacter polyketidifaciens]|uniref:hypothetical protein n=1 Tax=Candidatus Palauibacter polyketidifaciens TaxID=3056740 RepID=UPI00238708E5|nr:hypothetical protein [Candidatus Palauibacter polyketidifaciens]MDE2719933.1 hypothetical protein [Candidatus Palauibacter polyketidifaciens]